MKRKRKTKCKDCKYFVGGGKINRGLGLCKRDEYGFRNLPDVCENDFCSRGEWRGSK